VIDKDNDEKAAPNLARLFAFAALLVFGAVTLAWWGFLAWLFWHVIVVAVHDGSSGLRNGVMLAPSGSPPILPSGVSCSQSPPEGSLSVLVGRHGAMKPAGRVRSSRWLGPLS